VLLDRRTPSRLLSAMPAGVDVRRAGLAEAVRETAAFLAGAAEHGQQADSPRRHEGHEEERR
jgi:ATP-dependent DNA helicase DinG